MSQRCLQKSNLKFCMNMDTSTSKSIKTEKEDASNGSTPSTASRPLKMDNIADKIPCIPSSDKPEEMCRLCGKSGFDYKPIFGDDNLFIAEKISRCLPIVVLVNDGLPSQICSMCLQSLNVSYKLILTSTKMDSQLRHLFTEFKENPSSIISTNLDKDSLTNKSNSDEIVVTQPERLNFTLIYHGPMSCEMCNKHFTNMNEFDRHVETEHLLPWACNLCEKSFDSSQNLIEHKEAMHEGNVSICTGCIDTQELSEDLSSSMEKNRPEEVKQVKRRRTEKKKLCKQKSPKNEAKIEPNEGKKDTKLLETCDKHFVDTNESNRKVETENLVSGACNLCEKSFDSSQNLNKHKEAMHKENVSISTGCTDNQELSHDLCSSTEKNPREEVKKGKRRRTEKKKPCKEKIPKKEANIELNETKKDTKLLAVCDVCKIAFGNEELLTAHRRVHEKKILRCYICQTEVMSIYELFLHKREKHNVYKRIQLKFVCDVCGKFFSTNSRWFHHQRKIDCKKPKVPSTASSHTCKYCNSNFTTNLKLTRHLRKHKGEILKDPSATIYRCAACPKIYVDKEFYEKHRNFHDPECWKFKCDSCDKPFRNKKQLRRHQNSIHENENVKHQCDICDKTFHRLSNMRVHRKKHFGHKCDNCDETFEKLQLLAEHMKSVHNLESNFKLPQKKEKRTGGFVCRFCGKIFTAHYAVLDHENIHTGEKPYSCKKCDRTFRTYSAMSKHSQRHIERTYFCDHCGKSFGYKQNLRTHIQVHVPMENRNYRCTKCEKYFQRKSHLNVHMRVHDGIRPYTCEICQYSFTQLGDMKRHLARHAKGKIRSRKPRPKPVTNSSNEEDENQLDSNLPV